MKSLYDLSWSLALLLIGASSSLHAVSVNVPGPLTVMTDDTIAFTIRVGDLPGGALDIQSLGVFVDFDDALLSFEGPPRLIGGGLQVFGTNLLDRGPLGKQLRVVGDGSGSGVELLDDAVAVMVTFKVRGTPGIQDETRIMVTDFNFSDGFNETNLGSTLTTNVTINPVNPVPLPGAWLVFACSLGILRGAVRARDAKAVRRGNTV